MGFPPSAPRNVVAVSDYRSIDISWNQPIDFGSAVYISGYFVNILLDDSWFKMYLLCFALYYFFICRD